MSLLEEITPSPRKVMTLFYLVDTSGSMSGSRIGTVNAAMEECIPLLKEIAVANDDAEIKVAILQFSSGCSWVTPVSGPVGLDDIIWNDLQAGGMTEFGGALLELDKKLSRNEYLNSQTGAYAPVILLLSDGGPTDNWENGLIRLKRITGSNTQSRLLSTSRVDLTDLYLLSLQAIRKLFLMLKIQQHLRR